MTLSDIYGCEHGLSRHLGVSEVKVDGEELLLFLPTDEKHVNHISHVHGGTFSALCDVAVGAYQAWKKRPSAVLSSHVHFLRYGKENSVLCARVSPTKVGKTICVFTVKITDEEDTLLCEGIVESFVKER